MSRQFGEPDDEDLQCPCCSAYFCNEFALSLHLRQCQASVGQTEPEEPNEPPED